MKLSKEKIKIMCDGCNKDLFNEDFIDLNSKHLCKECSAILLKNLYLNPLNKEIIEKGFLNLKLKNTNNDINITPLSLKDNDKILEILLKNLENNKNCFISNEYYLTYLNN